LSSEVAGSESHSKRPGALVKQHTLAVFSANNTAHLALGYRSL